MSNRIKATINPALLIWARTTAGYELPSAAEALDISQEKLEAWEEGEDPGQSGEEVRDKRVKR
jgi:hypothetical protein